MSGKITAVGIDLGTTFSAASYVDPSGQTQMIPNGTGGALTPSAVYFDQDDIVVGAAALKARLLTPDRVAEHAKRDMGAAHYRHALLGQQFPPEVIQGCILRQLRDDIAKAIPGDFRVVITVPAYFDEARRKVTADAGTMSGLEVLDIVNEPTAAALAFGERLGYLLPDGAPRDCLRLVVYDLGGGTFDVTVIELSAGKVKTLATDGDYELGGLHWDDRLADYAQQRFRKLWPDASEFDPPAQARLQMAARAAKHQLSSSPLATLPFEFEGHQLALPVQRAEFEELTADLVERTIFTTHHALKAANLLWNDIDRLLLVGGSTRMPAIRAAIASVSGITPDDAVHPDEAVARGAAIYARNLLVERGIDTSAPKLSITDVNSHGLGIEGINLETQRAENITLIPRNTPLPYEVKRQFVTRTDNQRSIKVQLLEGDSTLPKQCSPLAVAAIKHLPPGLPKGTPVSVIYTLEANGRVTVKAEVRGAGDQAQIELERVRGLSDQKVNAWKTVLCRHGGFRDFEDSIVAMLRDEDPPERNDPAEQPAAVPSPPAPKPKANLEPAIDHGAPHAASQTLRSHANQATLKPTAKPAARPLPKPTPKPTPARPTTPLPDQTPQVKVAAKRKVVDLAPLAFALGHVAAGIIGLALGYYALCFVRPDLNVLELSLPGLEATASAEP